MKSFFLLTLGCPKNEVDSEFLMNELLRFGYEQALSPEGADVVLVNTCGFLRSALDEAKHALETLAEKKNDTQQLISVGCAVKRTPALFEDESLKVDHSFETWQETAGYLARMNGSEEEKSTYYHAWMKSRRLNLGVPFAYVKIAEGCDEHCSFCTIPTIKGAYRSKPADLILAEVGSLLDQGIKEVILIAQNTTAYGLDSKKARGLDFGDGKNYSSEAMTKSADNSPVIDSLAKLVRLICRSYPDLPWLRIMYAYPDYVTDDLIEAMRSQKQVCKYLDIPMQHADADVLQQMGRPYNVQKHVHLIKRLRQAMPEIVIRTTFIVGHPGESEEAFEHLRDFVRQIRFDNLGVFQYSPEAGTKSAELPNQVADRVKLRRYDELMGLQQSISFEINKKWIGRTLPVLLEGRVANKKDVQFVGRSYRSAPEIDGLVMVKGVGKVGEFVDVRITDADEYDLWGEHV